MPKERLILGGGIGGLSAAYYTLKNHPTIKTILAEATNRTGGWIRSTPHENRFIFEQGPRTIRPVGPAGANTLQLIEDLGLEDQLISISRSHPAAKNRMIYVNNQLHLLPSNLLSVFRKTSPFNKPLVSALITDIFAPRQLQPTNDESIYSFVERRLGREIAEYAISPLICGICAGDAKEISVKFLMKSLFETEQKYGSLTFGTIRNLLAQQEKTEKISSALIERAAKEKWSVYSFQGGLETLPRRLHEFLDNNQIDIQLNSPCNELIFNKNSVIAQINGTEQEFDSIISSLLASKLAPLVRKQHPILAEELEAIPTVTVAVVNLQFPRKIENLNAFGFLVPPSQNIPILGVIFDSCVFPSENNTVLTVMMGGRWFDKYFPKPTNQIFLDTAIKYVSETLKITDQVNSFSVNLLPNCIPQYIIGHCDRIDRINRYIKHNDLRLALCGASYYGVGVNDVILSAKNAALNSF